ncbi:prolactin receptor [Solea senegalensis]|uniref:Prolactin receptor n=1 Tax=Solea senegalensis TaxID=28829 RepID=A0AAV6R6S3_SOLSE|nr:prolactin receptor [Solea senegalensis]
MLNTGHDLVATLSSDVSTEAEIEESDRWYQRFVGGAMMTNVWEAVVLLLLPFLAPNAEGTQYSPPGKPALTRCRSPEKETFTCWWEPGSDGGLSTTYALYYRKENSETVYECPDYHTAGENSCFFNKNDTSIWVNYNITVVATNALGSSFSDPVDIDVVYIVKPNPPEELNVTIMEDKGWPYLRVSWKPPQKADTRSGWITLIYELRVKLEGEDDWEMHLAGQQKMFNIFSLRSGGSYHVQVRCKPDHGFWSEWSSADYIKVPDYFHREKSMWILITVFSTFIFLIFMCFLHMNSNRSLKYYILPPIPGPKIKGFDKQLLKNGKSDEIFCALVVPDFPPTTSSKCENLMVEYLEVYVSEEQELILEESKELHNSLKCEGSTSDNDSGRGSCDSHTLLMDKCGEAKGDERQTDGEGHPMEMEAQMHQRDWKEGTLSSAYQDIVSPDMSSGRVKTWPSVFSPLHQCGSTSLNQMNSLAMAKQHCLSDNLSPPGSASSFLPQSGRSTTETHRPNYCEFYSSDKQLSSPKPQAQTHRKLQAHSDINISHKQAGLQSPALRPTEYVEVQRVNKEDMVLLQPVESGCVCGDGCPQVCQDYSKVKGLNSDNMLLLHRDVMEGEEVRSHCEKQETNGCITSHITPATQKPTDCIPTVTPIVQKEMGLAVSGYVDTAAMLTLPTH